MQFFNVVNRNWDKLWPIMYHLVSYMLTVKPYHSKTLKQRTSIQQSTQLNEPYSSPQ